MQPLNLQLQSMNCFGVTQVERIGPMHQAGSDSLLTAATFFKLVEVYFNGNLDDSKYAGLLYGLGRAVDPSASENS